MGKLVTWWHRAMRDYYKKRADAAALALAVGNYSDELKEIRLYLYFCHAKERMYDMLLGEKN